MAEKYLKSCVQHAGEEEKYTTAHQSRGFEPLEIAKQQSLTLDDYLQEREPEKLKKK